MPLLALCACILQGRDGEKFIRVHNCSHSGEILNFVIWTYLGTNGQLFSHKLVKSFDHFLTILTISNIFTGLMSSFCLLCFLNDEQKKSETLISSTVIFSCASFFTVLDYCVFSRSVYNTKLIVTQIAAMQQITMNAIM